MATDGVFQRSTWDGTPCEVAVWWTLKKGQCHAVCRMFTHAFGFELRLEVSRDLVASQAFRTADGADPQILEQQETWRTGLEGKGWKHD